MAADVRFVTFGDPRAKNQGPRENLDTHKVREVARRAPRLEHGLRMPPTRPCVAPG